MKLEELYRQTFDKMKEEILRHNNEKKFPALGYTSNLDILCDFQIDVLNDLLKKYLPNASLAEMKAVDLITCMEEFLQTVVSFCLKGIGGERDISDFNILENTFPVTLGMGGTATQGAMALAAVDCPSVIHLTDDSREVCTILKSPYIFTVSENGQLVHTDEIVQKAEQEIHYIIQYTKGDRICLGDQVIEIPVSNRLIITKITVNETVPFSKPYFEYIENHAEQISSNVLSSFNGLQDTKLLSQRLEFVKKHIQSYKEKNERGIVYFEDAHYHSNEIRKLCLETIYPQIDIVSMNEEELAYTLEMYGFPMDINDSSSCVKGAIFIREKFQIKKGVIIHTKDYSMYVGAKLEANIENGLMYGNLLATAKAMTGWYGSREQIRAVMDLPLSEKGMKFREEVGKEQFTEEVIVVPSKYLDKPKYTIGLGDSFVAGVQICFL